MRWVIAVVASQLVLACFGGVARAQSLDVTFSTGRTGGRYYPAHVMAVWVTSSDGTFERTLHVWGSRRRSHLSEWNAAHPRTESLDGITSATLRTSAMQEVTWDLLDTTGALVPDGDYEVHFEYADTNSTSANYREHFSFRKGPDPVDSTQETFPFLGVHIVHTPGAPPPTDLDGGVGPAGVPKLIPIGRGYGSRGCSAGPPGAPMSASWIAWALAVLFVRRRRG